MVANPGALKEALAPPAKVAAKALTVVSLEIASEASASIVISVSVSPKVVNSACTTSSGVPVNKEII